MRDPAHVCVIGGVSVDLVVQVDEFPPPRPHTAFAAGFREVLGSTGAGKALNLARLGVDVALHAMIGDDAHGRLVRDCLASQKIEFFYDVDPMGTQRHVNLMDRRGQRISIFLNDGTFEPAFDPDPVERAITRADVVALNIRNYCRALIPVIREHGKPIWVDIHDYDGSQNYHRDFIAAADVVFASSQALTNYRGFMQRLIDQGKALVVCTHGADGASALDAAGQWVDVPIIDAYPLVDSNGAGDSFFAGFLYGHLRGDSLLRCMRQATICAGLCVSSPELFHDQLDPAVLAAEYRRHHGDA